MRRGRAVAEVSLRLFRRSFGSAKIKGMNYDYMHQLLHAEPFEPFAVHLSNGEVHAIRHPECATLTRTRLVVADLKADRITVCSLLDIANVEMLQRSPALYALLDFSFG